MSKVALDGVVIAETVDVLQSVECAIDGVKRALGAPGDHGYGTAEGQALMELYRVRNELFAARAPLVATGYCASETWTIVPIIDEPAGKRRTGGAA